jgi:Universal stress protein family
LPATSEVTPKSSVPTQPKTHTRILHGVVPCCARRAKTAKERSSDLIVLGIRDASGRIGAATHLARATAHKVVAHALCPVLTVRENINR